MNRPHRFAAILAAYAIALQALFGAFTVPAHLAFAGAAICQSSADSGVPPQPLSHDDCCPGCLSGHCAHLDGAPRAAMFVPWPATTAPGVIAHAGAVPLRLTENGPHAARAPPIG